MFAKNSCIARGDEEAGEANGVAGAGFIVWPVYWLTYAGCAGRAPGADDDPTALSPTCWRTGEEAGEAAGEAKYCDGMSCGCRCMRHQLRVL